jgi:hypothetical protein
MATTKAQSLTGCFDPYSMQRYLSILSFAYLMEDDGWSKSVFEQNAERFGDLSEWQEDFEQAVLEMFQYTTDPKYTAIPDTAWMQPFAPVIAQLFENMPKLLRWGGKKAELEEFKAKRAKKA